MSYYKELRLELTKAENFAEICAIQYEVETYIEEFSRFFSTEETTQFDNLLSEIDVRKNKLNTLF